MDPTTALVTPARRAGRAGQRLPGAEQGRELSPGPNSGCLPSRPYVHARRVPSTPGGSVAPFGSH